MEEIIKNLLSNGTALWTTFISFMVANFSTVLVLVITILRNKANAIANKDRLERFIAENDIKLNDNVKAIIADAMEEMKKQINLATSAVYSRMKIDSEEKEQALKEQSEKCEEIKQNILKILK